jgi:ABC-type multidrug transport system fused ATPase/permease subunit
VRTLIVAFCVFMLMIEISFPVGAVVTPPVDDIDIMLARIQKNLAMASEVTKVAQKTSEKLVDTKVEEKAELKEAVVVAEAKMEEVKEQMQKVEEKVEFYQVKMIGSGVDTSFQEVSFKGPIYEAYLNYVEEGGKEDFEYFRVYLWQPK